MSGGSDGAACGLEARKGEQYLVLAYRESGSWILGRAAINFGLCSMQDLGYGAPGFALGAARPPRSGASTVDLYRLPKLLGVAVVLLIGAWVIKRRRTSTGEVA